MKLNRKLWTAALAVAMTTPSAMAAQDTAGMHYTSAAEGFYASIRVRYNANGNSKDGGADLQNSSSRIGVRGTNDLGGGLEGFYQYEMGVGTDQGDTDDMKTRVAHVGLRGDFGDVVAGAFWTNSYNWVYGSTDVANMQSGSFAYGDFGQGRSDKSLQYSTPDLNGFRGALLIQADSGSPDYDGDGKDDNDIDHWNLAATYDIAGFSMGASYSNSPDAMSGQFKEVSGYVDRQVDQEFESAKAQLVALAGQTGAFQTAIDGARGGQSREDYISDLVDAARNATTIGVSHKKEDVTSWAVKLGYSQDNWYVNSWYGEINHGDGMVAVDASASIQGQEIALGELYRGQDTEVFSIAGGISVDKVSVYAVHENKENQYAEDDSFTTLGVQYTLGSNSWTWVEYAGQDRDSKDDEDDTVSIGLGHSF